MIVKTFIFVNPKDCLHLNVGNSWGWYVCKDCGEIW
jgi:hypothetical protein